MHEFFILRDGKQKHGPFPNYEEARRFLLGIQPQSVDWASRYEGWEIRRVEVA